MRGKEQKSKCYQKMGKIISTAKTGVPFLFLLALPSSLKAASKRDLSAAIEIQLGTTFSKLLINREEVPTSTFCACLEMSLTPSRNRNAPLQSFSMFKEPLIVFGERDSSGDLSKVTYHGAGYGWRKVFLADDLFEYFKDRQPQKRCSCGQERHRVPLFHPHYSISSWMELAK